MTTTAIDVQRSMGSRYHSESSPIAPYGVTRCTLSGRCRTLHRCGKERLPQGLRRMASKESRGESCTRQVRGRNKRRLSPATMRGTASRCSSRFCLGGLRRGARLAQCVLSPAWSSLRPVHRPRKLLRLATEVAQAVPVPARPARTFHKPWLRASGLRAPWLRAPWLRARARIHRLPAFSRPPHLTQPPRLP